MSETNAMTDAGTGPGLRTPTVAELFATAGLVATPTSSPTRTHRRGIVTPALVAVAVVVFVVAAINFG